MKIAGIKSTRTSTCIEIFPPPPPPPLSCRSLCKNRQPPRREVLNSFRKTTQEDTVTVIVLVQEKDKLCFNLCCHDETTTVFSKISHQRCTPPPQSAPHKLVIDNMN